jgi:hypothetical protein
MNRKYRDFGDDPVPARDGAGARQSTEPGGTIHSLR